MQQTPSWHSCDVGWNGVWQAPRYWEPFVAHVASNARRVVVPSITSLDVRNWLEAQQAEEESTGAAWHQCETDGESSECRHFL